MPSRRLPLPYFGFSCNFRSPCDSTASHTQAIFPYGIVVSPYNYTPDAFPHTLHQISIGRPSPHTFSADPPYNPQAPKNPNPNPKRPASGAADPQPTLTNRYPGPASHLRKSSACRPQQLSLTCVTVQQTKCRPSPANPTDLRLGVAPARTRSPSRARARPWACTRASVPWSRFHGYVNIPLSGTPSPRPATGSLKCAPD